MIASGKGHPGAGPSSGHPAGFRGEIPPPLRLYLEAQPRRVRMLTESGEVVWSNRPEDAAEQLRFPGSMLAGGTIPQSSVLRESWPVTRVVRGEARAARLYSAPVRSDGRRRPEFLTWRVTAWPMETPHGRVVIEETELVDSPDEDANRLLQLDQNIEDLLHGVVVRLQEGLDFSALRLPNPHLLEGTGGCCSAGTDCPAQGEPVGERCWEIVRLPGGDGPDGPDGLLKRFEACSRCRVFAEASPDPMVRISENFNRLIALLQAKFQEDLDVSQRMQQADKLAIMGELLAGIAHEIKNPLGIIIGRLDVLGLELEAEATETLTEDLATIHLQANRVKQIIDHLLLMARPEPPHFKPVSMNGVITDCLTMARKTLAEKGIQVVLELDPDVPPVAADVIQMQQVLLNLILNARDAMEEGGTLTLTSALGEDGLRVTVRDTGEGIPSDQLRRIFSSFHTTKLSRGGTGLGLAVCLRIVRSHQGRITAESEVGRGTAMHLHLPLRDCLA